MADTPAPPTTTRPPREQRFERRMTDAEALMWNVEKDPWLNPNGGSVSILDRMPDMANLRGHFAAAVVTVPRLMERAVGGFGRYSPPTWRPDPEFDLDHHLRVIALPSPGSTRQLLDAVARIYQDPFDRTRPLWMMYVIDGLEGGRAATLFKIHHAVADGTGAARLSELFIQPTRQAPTPPPVDLRATVDDAVAADAESDPRPSVVESVVGTATHLFRRQAGIARRVAGEMAMWGADPQRARDVVGGAVKTVGQLRDQVTGGSDPTPAAEEGEPQLPGGSPLWRNRSRHRYLEVMSFPLDQALAAAKGLGGSLNDWFVTGVVNGAVAFHDEQGVPLRTLNTSFVVSTRADKAIGGNSFTPSRFAAPAGPMDPADRFKLIGESMAERRSQVSTGGTTLSGLAGLANLLPTSLVTGIARSQAAKMDFATSNLRSSKRKFYMSGGRVDEAYPFGPLAGTAFNITAISYAGQFAIGLFMDPVAIDDVTGLRDHVEAAYTELIDLGTS